MGHTRKPLPGARSISVAVSTPNDQSDVSRTLTVMQWGQFVANDISYTPMRKMGKRFLFKVEKDYYTRVTIWHVFFRIKYLQWKFIFIDMYYDPCANNYKIIAVSTGKPISCCRSDGNTLSPRYVHPDCSVIMVPDRDPIYGQHYVRCMNYVRSLPVLKAECTFGPAEQVYIFHFFYFL